MEQILLAYGLPKETITALIMLYKNSKAMVCATNGNTNFDIVTGVLEGDTLASYLFIICLDCILKTSNKRKWFHNLKKKDKKQMISHETIMQTTQMI